MMIRGFAEELEKVGADQTVQRMVKLSGTDSAPIGMMGTGVVEPGIELRPDRAETRLSSLIRPGSMIIPGNLGGVTAAGDPIDRMRFNRTDELNK